MSQAALDTVKKINSGKPICLSDMTIEEKIELIEAYDFVVSRYAVSPLTQFYCVWDPHDCLHGGWCVRGASNILDDTIRMIEFLGARK